jgi:regulator of replication initiation timing
VDSSSSKEDEKVKHKQGDFICLYLMGKSWRSIPDSGSDVSDDLSFEGLSLRVAELENALCNYDKLLRKVFRENKKLNLELENPFSEIASLPAIHDDMSTKPYDNCRMIMVNYADMLLVHAKIGSQFDDVSLELRELKDRSKLLDACTSCPLLRSDLEASNIEIKYLKHKLDHSSRYNILSPPCEMCGSLKGKLFHATKENTELKQEIAYLSSRLERTVVSEKTIVNDLSRVEESATNSTYKLHVGFERCEDRAEKSAPKFIPISTYHKEDETIKSIKAPYPSNRKPSFNPKRKVRK